MIVQLDPPIPVWIPARAQAGLAHLVMDDGIEHDTLWVVFLMDGEVWTFRQAEIRVQANVTLGRRGSHG